MLKIYQTVILIFLLIISLSVYVYAEDITPVNDLIEKAKELDGKEVIIQGEAIGERLDRGDYSWVNINDGTNAIGIWLNKDEAIRISKYGSYKNKGDIVKVTGIFRRACKKHGGEADIHSSKIEIAEEGYPVKEQISSGKIIAASILTFSALLFLIFFFKQLRLKIEK